MKAGRLNRRIEIQRQGPETDDGLTTITGEFLPLVTVWAEFRPAGGSERFANAENMALAPATFAIRYGSVVADVNPKDRIVHSGLAYDIKSVEVTKPNEEILITATARNDGQV
jgi:SPP1 family predicted phage head-tail adaptor